MHHLNEDDLVLHYYGELAPADEVQIVRHLAECTACQASYAGLQRVLAAVDAAPSAPDLPEDFERQVWTRLQPSLQASRVRWAARWPALGAGLAAAAAVVLLVGAGFFAGRSVERATAPTLSADDLRERILLVDVGEHLDRSQSMLVELVTADSAVALDMMLERERAADLVADNRLYRQTAMAAGDTGLSELLDELERLLVDLAAGPDQLSPEDMELVRTRIDAGGLLFKIRVVSAAVRQRQQEQILVRAGQTS